MEIEEFRQERRHAATVCRHRIGDWNRRFLIQLAQGEIEASEVGARAEVASMLRNTPRQTLLTIGCSPFPLLVIPHQAWDALAMPERLGEPAHTRSPMLQEALTELVLTLQHVLARDVALATLILGITRKRCLRIELSRLPQIMEWARRVDGIYLFQGMSKEWWLNLLRWNDESNFPIPDLVSQIYLNTIQFAPYATVTLRG